MGDEVPRPSRPGAFLAGCRYDLNAGVVLVARLVQIPPESAPVRELDALR